MNKNIDDDFKGCFSNNIIAHFDFDKRDEPLIYQRKDGTIIANMDRCAIIPREKYFELIEETDPDTTRCAGNDDTKD